MNKLHKWAGGFAVVAAGLLSTGSPAAATSAHALIQGSGSSWAANAVNQWIADVHSNGLQVVFTSNGSAQGRKDFANNTVDFAVSDIGFQGVDPKTGQDDTSQGRDYAYLPIVAGGTSLPYQIRVGGQLVRNLRLSGETITKIFTQQITNWDDPAITADNNGHALPSIPIIPVVHSEGSGSSYQFTRYMATEFPSIWTPFAGVGATEYFPPPSGSAVAENGSDGVMNFISSGAANGAIGYDEYSYALGKNYPVAKVLNAKGYYTLPNQYNVAVALTKAEINTDKNSPDYLLQNLDQVYTYGDPRVYPISSYSYAVIPTAADDSKMTTAKRQTLADYLQYSVCQGQEEMGRIGYSPLPINLVQASFDQVKLLHTADSGVDVSNETVTACHNPTFIAGHPSENYLAKIAPQPEPCDKQGAGPCTDDGNTGQTNPGDPGGPTGNGNGNGNGNGHGGNGHGGNGNGNGNGGGNVTENGGGNGTGNGGGTGTGTGTGGTGATGGGSGTHIDPTTGQLVNNNPIGGQGGGTGQNLAAVANPTVLTDSQSHNVDVMLGVLAGGLLLGALIAPPLVGALMSRRKGQQ
jgi:phosphate ABC transporter phosphate-binding protein